MKILSVTKNTILAVTLVSSIVLNVATVASSTVATVMSGMYEAVTGLPSGHTKKQFKSKQVVRNVSKKISKRTVALAARNAGSVVAEAIPYVGIAAMLGVTAMDLYDACETMKDMQILNNTFNSDDNTEHDVDEVCGLQVPTTEQVWTSVKNSPEKAWKSATSHLPSLADLTLTERYSRGRERLLEAITQLFN